MRYFCAGDYDGRRSQRKEFAKHAINAIGISKGYAILQVQDSASTNAVVKRFVSLEDVNWN
ncbi:MAG: hypothetical protein IKN12_01395 [Selenomonadaceae bacterium]|nr:hypothetical protein [Selenomonadaceae bacterium]MBR3721396.1 hypothetical protein [Selenomonadaceae bacterium]